MCGKLSNSVHRILEVDEERCISSVVIWDGSGCNRSVGEVCLMLVCCCVVASELEVVVLAGFVCCCFIVVVGVEKGWWGRGWLSKGGAELVYGVERGVCVVRLTRDDEKGEGDRQFVVVGLVGCAVLINWRI